MAKFSMPKRDYCTGEKKMISMRLPMKLMAELERLAVHSGWTTTDLITTALDQYVQWENRARRSKRER